MEKSNAQKKYTDVLQAVPLPSYRTFLDVRRDE
jgi:hypothetical protein